MTLSEVAVLYLLVGVSCAVVVMVRAPEPRRRHLGSAAAAIPLWPIWAPLALASFDPRAARPGATSGAVPGPSPHRADGALEAAHRTAAGTELAHLLDEGEMVRLRHEVAVLGGRLAALDQLAASYQSVGVESGPSCHAPEAARPVTPPAGAAALSAAAMRTHSFARLREARARTQQALLDVAELAEALHAELLMLRVGAAATGTDDDTVASCARVLALRDRLDEALEEARRMATT